MNEFSLGESIAALQSIMLYGIMRVTISGRSYSEINSSIVRTMEKLSFRWSALTATPFSTRHTRDTRPTWEEWICEETRRRISVTCFLLALTIGNDPSNPIVNPNNHILPASKALWEARTRAAWERLYVQQQTSDSAPRLETVGDFIIAKLGGVGRSKSDMSADLVDDMIGKWYAEMDGLGMMLAAVVASL
ncbi:uncharacterized protein N0V89_005254 [Didymosphaeria variabile]|uniref:Transcription factor domain-containing protein n=1 Tax=Didymosphaeria variabile TaxID=1932322 RepID=A0A9W8XL53_9PLEO|nr:uncharacterized protein N0V89_005254 [Didymosphaeria variabile]KAJ4353524.1 hypothetical protein N0V89_005254 [Didymosphaeria variabile]